MNEIKNSEILDQILYYANEKLITKKVKIITAEMFMISVIDFIKGVYGSFDYSNEECRRLHLLFMVYFGAKSSDYDLIKAQLNDRIKEYEDNTYIESLYIQRCFYNAKDVVSKKLKTDQLTADTLLVFIFEHPNPYLKRRLTDKFGIKPDSEKEQSDEDVIDLKSMYESPQEDKPEDDVFAEEKTDDPKVDSTEFHKNYMTQLTEKVKTINEKLLESIYGQDHAVSVFTSGYFRAELSTITDRSRTKPKATFLFAGPPGVGKTFLAETAAKTLGLPCKRFDMSEYSDKEAHLMLCGFAKTYKDSRPGALTEVLSKTPKCIILFDEIEKANINVIHLFLQILDAGHVRDNYHERNVSFKDSILIFTTNAGKQLYEDSELYDFSGVSRKVILNALRNDINPETKTPFFPAAICSRFASGNVVMFNYMTANNLSGIAKKEILKHAENLRKEVGIKIKIDEKVYTSLLFAEGGSADARTVKSRAESFFNDELYELFRLLSSNNTDAKIKDIETIRFKVELPTNNKEICALFKRRDPFNILVFAPDEVGRWCSENNKKTRFYSAETNETAKIILHDNDINAVFIDMMQNADTDKKYLNIEDVDSEARDFFWHTRNLYPDMPVFILQTSDRQISEDEKMSFKRQGVRDILTVFGNGRKFATEIDSISERLYHQSSMEKLAKSNKVIAYETAQSIKNDGKVAEITLFDFELSTAVEAEDKQNIMSSISKPKERFDDVIGAENAIEELKFFIEYLKDPRRFVGSGLRAPRGVLLYGPPGTGKTLLAKATAAESDVTFISAEGNQFLKQYQGQGSEKVHEIFKTARKYAPSILFIDEIDAIAKERRGGDSGDAEATLTSFLAEMDGFKNDTTKPVFVLAATNYDVEPGGPKSLDPALVRRFDRKIYIDLPSRSERTRYVKQKMAKNPAFNVSEEKINNFSLRSTGMSLAELELILELSLRTAIRDGNLKVTDDVLEDAFETFNYGEAKDRDQASLERTARHEAGHAFLYWESGNKPSYVTIVARSNFGGYMQHDDSEKNKSLTKTDILSLIRTSLGGRAAELVYYGEEDGLTVGACSDLSNATNLARQIICTFGMSEEFGLAVIDKQSAMDGVLSIEIRNAVNAILSEEMAKAKKIIEDNKNAIDALVEKLMSDNHLTGDEIVEVFEKNTGNNKER